MLPHFLPHQVEKAVHRLLEDLASPVSLKVALLLRHGEYDQLASCRVDPRSYIEAESYWRDATAVSLLRKLPELPTTIDRKAVAEKSFLDCEASCLRANQRIYPLLFGDDPSPNGGVSAYIKRARKIAASVLGICPDYDKIDGRFGPGATYGDRGRLTTIPDKMSSVPTLTSEAWSLHFPWSGTLWASACASSGRKVSFVRGNRFTTVPKDATKDRGIAVEPSLNVFYQLGLGRVIRRRLLRAGIDLTNGQDIHRRIACEASIGGHLATIDLSNASDTICRNLVKLLLPKPWFERLDELRSHRTEFRGRWYLLEKFSSMGNGFTFELETLVFLCLILAISPDLTAGKNVFVFGDDIIVPTEYSSDVISILSFFGMTANRAKSFVDGPFRESCGGDYFMGVDVRPYFMKEAPNEPQQLISVANGLRRSTRASKDRSSHAHRAWRSILDALPSEIRRLRGPEDLGNLLVHDREESWRPRWRNGIREFRVWKPIEYHKVSLGHFKPEVTLAAACYGLGPNASEGIIPRDGVRGYGFGWVPRS